MHKVIHVMSYLYIFRYVSYTYYNNRKYDCITSYINNYISYPHESSTQSIEDTT